MKEEPVLREKISAIASVAIVERVFPGCVMGVVKKNGDSLILAFGNFTYEHDSSQVQPDTVYDVASVTKTIPTASLALYLIDRGKLRLDEKLITYLPEYRGSYRNEITIEHLLTQTLQFSFSLASIAQLGRQKILQKIFSSTLLSVPGNTYHYANATSVLLGFIIERVVGMTLDKAAQSVFFEPLGMTSTTFSPSSDVPPTEIVGGLSIQGVVHDESTRAMLPFHVGAAGLFSTVPDLLQFVHMMLRGGELSGEQFFSRALLKKIYTNPSGLSHRFGLGWELEAPWMGNGRRGMIGKTGFTGSMVALDIDKGVGIVHLSNRTFPRRPNTGDAINRVRAEIVATVLACA
ncbi:MAG: hypothetical protein RLZZ455_529 [Candidatus Parcubacteria bacterium]|jgi:CubicO group peptidase (beta-lactamase class C family)